MNVIASFWIHKLNQSFVRLSENWKMILLKKAQHQYWNTGMGNSWPTTTWVTLETQQTWLEEAKLICESVEKSVSPSLALLLPLKARQWKTSNKNRQQNERSRTHSGSGISGNDKKEARENGAEKDKKNWQKGSGSCRFRFNRRLRQQQPFTFYYFLKKLYQ